MTPVRAVAFTRSWHRFRDSSKSSRRSGIKPTDAPERVVAAAEFLLEGMVAHRKLSRSEERGFSAGERGRRNDRERTTASDEEMYEAFQTRRNKRGGSFN